jgi:hypothetical protein
MPSLTLAARLSREDLPHTSGSGASSPARPWFIPSAGVLVHIVVHRRPSMGGEPATESGDESVAQPPPKVCAEEGR